MQLAIRSTKLPHVKSLSFNKFLGISTTIKNHQKAAVEPTGSESEWNTIYKCNKIKHLLAVVNLKYYQFGFTVLAVPVSFFIPVADPSVIASIGITGTISLALGSYAMRNAIGFIYTNKKNPNLVKLAYLTFWGGRKDIEIDVGEVKPLSELPVTKLDNFFTNIEIHDNPMRLKLIYKYGGVVDSDEFNRVFGDTKTYA